MSGRKFGIYYNQQFNVYMVALTPNLVPDDKEQKGNVVALKNNQNIIGFNIFPTQPDHQPNTTFCSELPSIVNYVERKVRPFMNLVQEPQFLVAKILKRQPIAGTHLFRCDLDIAQKQPIQVITGAQNVAIGQYSVLATEGAWMPSSQVITAKKMQGYDTTGMLCSTTDLHLKNSEFNQTGIIDLPKRYQPYLGQSFWKVYYGGDKA